MHPTFATISRLFLQGGYGFATTEDGREIYFHAHAISQGTFAQLKVGDMVELEVDNMPHFAHANAVALLPLHR